MAGDGVQDRIGPASAYGLLGPRAVALVEADQREAERGEDGRGAAGGVHGLGPQVLGDLAEQLDEAGPVEPDVQAGLAQDHGHRAERSRVPHVVEHLERLAGQPPRLAEAPGRQREVRRVGQVMPLPYRAAQPFQAGAEVSELTLDIPELTSLKQGVDPPQPAPHLDPGAAEGIGRLEHPFRQHDPLSEALGGAAGQLAGPERVDERDRFVRRVGAEQRLPANLSGAVILAPVHQRLRVLGRHPGPQVVRKVVPGQRLLADAADLTVPFRYAGGLHGQRRVGQPEPVPPTQGPAPDSGGRLLRSGQVAAAVQGRG